MSAASRKSQLSSQCARGYTAKLTLDNAAPDKLQVSIHTEAGQRQTAGERKRATLTEGGRPCPGSNHEHALISFSLLTEGIGEEYLAGKQSRRETSSSAPIPVPRNQKSLGLKKLAWGRRDSNSGGRQEVPVCTSKFTGLCTPVQ
jgi:hypothetical protein